MQFQAATMRALSSTTARVARTSYEGGEGVSTMFVAGNFSQLQKHQMAETLSLLQENAAATATISSRRVAFAPNTS